jgi:hypothetical protein
MVVPRHLCIQHSFLPVLPGAVMRTDKGLALALLDLYIMNLFRFSAALTLSRNHKSIQSFGYTTKIVEPAKFVESGR